MNLVSKAEFARLAAITKAAVTKAVKGSLAAAAVGPRIDLGHPAAAEYLARRATAPTRKPQARRRFDDDEIDELADLALRVLDRLIVRARRGRSQLMTGSNTPAPTSAEGAGDAPEA